MDMITPMPIPIQSTSNCGCQPMPAWVGWTTCIIIAVVILAFTPMWVELGKSLLEEWGYLINDIKYDFKHRRKK